MQGLAIGRIVHVCLPTSERVRPAIITSVRDPEKGLIGCQIFADPLDPPGVPVDENTGLEFGTEVPFTTEPGNPGYWNWPPRV